MNINRHEFLAGVLAVFVALAADAVVLSGADAENGFAGVVSAYNAKMSKTGECLSFTNIAYDTSILSILSTTDCFNSFFSLICWN